jgi:hypothetical protein
LHLFVISKLPFLGMNWPVLSSYEVLRLINMSPIWHILYKFLAKGYALKTFNNIFVEMDIDSYSFFPPSMDMDLPVFKDKLTT